jgi:hypothetical protein
MRHRDAARPAWKIAHYRKVVKVAPKMAAYEQDMQLFEELGALESYKTKTKIIFGLQNEFSAMPN